MHQMRNRVIAKHPALLRPLKPLRTCSETLLTLMLFFLGIVFDAGEQLVLKIAGHPLILAEFEPLRGAFQTWNKGEHLLHMGGKYDSHIEVPFIEL